MRGACHAGLGEHAETKRWAGEGVLLARSLGEESALVDLLVLRGGAARTTSDFTHAASDYREALALMDRRPLSTRAEDLPLRLRILAALTGHEFYLAQHTEARAHIQFGLSIVDSRHRQHQANLLWHSALLHRWDNQPQKALEQATRAAELLQDLGSPCSLVRLKTVVADAALDVAARSPLGSDARTLALATADQTIDFARQLARQHNDPNGEALAVITRARLTRLRNGDLNAAEADAHFGLLIADNAADLCLRAQSFTVLGDLRIARENPEGARAAYLRARIAAAESVLPALDLWIDHGLRAVQELTT
jgi:hypothetical protein